MAVKRFLFRSMFQFVGVTLGSTLFNTLSGLIQFAFSIKFFRTIWNRLFAAYILTIISSMFFFLYVSVLFQNNILLYIIASSVFKKDWISFDEFFEKQYTVSTLTATVISHTFICLSYYTLQTILVLGKGIRIFNSY